MTTKNKIFAALAAAAIILSFNAGYRTARKAQEGAVKVKVDTLVTYRVDTVSLAPKIIREYVRDTMRVELATFVHDTTYIEIPREVKVYASDSCYAEVSGYQPSLDSLVIFPREKTVTVHEVQTIREPRLTIGASCGYAVTPKGLQPYAGVGVNYRLVSIKFSRN